MKDLSAALPPGRVSLKRLPPKTCRPVGTSGFEELVQTEHSDYAPLEKL